jgi:hypothetical protein
VRRYLLIIIISIFPVLNAYSMMTTSNSSLFPARKSVGEMIESNSNILLRFSTISALRVLINDLAFSKVIYGNYSFSASALNSIMEGPDYHAGELSLTRGFSDNQVFGLLGVGYRMARFSYNEHWLYFMTSTGYIPDPWGIETSLIYYCPLSQRSARLRADILAIYNIQTEFFKSLEFGIQTSFYIIPSGELGSPDVSGIPEAHALIEEFFQIEGGFLVRYKVRNFINFEMLVTNILFINQKDYEAVSADGGVSRIVTRGYAYAPKVMLSLSVKL